MRAPAWWKRRTVAAPIPREPPVMRATVLSSERGTAMGSRYRNGGGAVEFGAELDGAEESDGEENDGADELQRTADGDADDAERQ